MTENRSYPLEDPRYGVAQASMLGLLNQPGRVPPAGGYAGFDDDREASYKPNRAWAIVLGLMLGLAAVLLLVRDSGVQ